MEENRVKVFLIRIWPAIYRIINGVAFFLITLLKNTVSMAIRQIRDL